MIAIDGTFVFSQRPSHLEYYRCFKDLSRGSAVDGMELYDNRETWDERTKLKWKFFYRPIRSWVGRPQRRMIGHRRAKIFAAESQAQWLKKDLVEVLVGCAILAFSGYVLWEPLAIAPAGFALFRSARFWWVRRKLRKHLGRWRQELDTLNQEIRFLLAQVWEPPDPEEVERMVREEMQALERLCLAEIVNDSGGDEELLFSHIRHAPLQRKHNRYGLRGMLVEGWGAVQPAEIRGPFGKEKTGLQRVVHEIGNRVGTFRVDSVGRVVHRVPYLQFIFLLENNINVYALFYDFVTGKKYGKRGETFQYNHVTNYAIRDVEPEESEVVRSIELPSLLHNRIFDQDISAFSLAVANGAHFQCVLLDDALARGINEWLEADAACRVLEQELESREGRAWDEGSERESAAGDGRELSEAGRQAYDAELDRLRQSDQEELELELEQLAAQRSALEAQGVHVARRVLQQIREEIENFVRRVSGRGGGVFSPGSILK